MTRLHADAVEVRTRADANGPVPEQFLWRGRPYVVREVLARWTSSGVWWKGATDTGLDDRETQWWRVLASRRSELASDGRAVLASRRSELASDGRAVLASRRSELASDGRAVEADSGRLAALSGGAGTYDLCLSWSTGTWALRRVLD